MYVGDGHKTYVMYSGAGHTKSLTCMCGDYTYSVCYERRKYHPTSLAGLSLQLLEEDLAVHYLFRYNEALCSVCLFSEPHVHVTVDMVLSIAQPACDCLISPMIQRTSVLLR